MPRPLTDRGKGSYWTVNEHVDPRTGVHRIRKKKAKTSKSRGSDEGDVDYHPENSFDEGGQFAQGSMEDGGPSKQAVPFPAPYP